MEEVKINKEEGVDNVQKLAGETMRLIVETALIKKAIELADEAGHCIEKLITASWITSIYWKYRLRKVNKRIHTLTQSIEQWNDIKEKEGYGIE